MDGRYDIHVRGQLVVVSTQPGATVGELRDSCDDVVVSDGELPRSAGVVSGFLLSGSLPADLVRLAVARVAEEPQLQLFVDLGRLDGDLSSYAPLGVDGVGWLGDVPVVAMSVGSTRTAGEVDDLWARLLMNDPRRAVGREREDVTRLRSVVADLRNSLEVKNERLAAQRERAQRVRARLKNEKAARAKAERRREAVERSRVARVSRASSAMVRRLGGRPVVAVAGAAAFVVVAVAVGWLAAAGGIGAGIVAACAFVGAVASLALVLWAVRRAASVAQGQRHAVRKALEMLAERHAELTEDLESERTRHAEEWQELQVSVRRLEVGQSRTATAVRALETGLNRDVSRRTVENSAQLAQIQSAIHLFSLLPVEGRVPAMGGWAASPDLVEVVVDELLSRRPSLIVECGSGVSTLWFGLAIRHFGLDCKVVALEHHEGFGEQTRAVLARHGLGDVAEVRDAPLTEVDVAGYRGRWYDPAALETLSDVGLLLVDGPPAATGVHARFPAVPMMRDRFADRVSVVLDDMIRNDEQEVARMWEELLPGFSREDLRLQKRATIFRRG
ncbi:MULTISPECIES: class I SAM-dependent methyltransferase [Mumia]|uniref:Class I SAM-dependent methyltransferase n=1 Tax=Mumia xiangluensis TaxID=1678900 RepID=A0ABW1QQR9_9ACTN|nr:MULTISPECIES: class I SAM-dependent methyltransferase [Mumia]